jgi:hypothetical protein
MRSQLLIDRSAMCLPSSEPVGHVFAHREGG